jgi:mersacidin/lichenicidin family type 2 lantibiotic
MTVDQIIMAWKTADYGVGLGDATLSSLPASPAGAVELADPTLQAGGGSAPGSGRNGIRHWFYYSQAYWCSAYGDNLWRQEL